MMLKPQDILILLKLLLIKPGWTYADLASSLYMSASEVHAGVKRAIKSKLFSPHTKKPNKKSLEEFLIHGVKYAYPPNLGGQTRGIVTAYAAPPLNKEIIQGSDLPPVWPYPEGENLGFEFSPLFKSVPRAALVDSQLYELLALIDAIRGGRARERNLAVKEIQKRIGENEQSL